MNHNVDAPATSAGCSIGGSRSERARPISSWLAIACAIALAVIAGTRFDARPVAVVVPPLRVEQVDAVSLAGKAITQRSPRAADDLIARYMDMRDDLNPIPRLAFIEDAARGADAAAADLLAQAQVDPDERVRARARQLFDRAMPVRHSSNGS